MTIPDSITVGLEGTRSAIVDDQLVTRHVGGEGVLATPAMVNLMEILSHETVAVHLPPGLTTVGYEIHVRHLAPSELGTRIEIRTRVADVQGNKILFEVSCREGGKLVGEGIHRRAVVTARPPSRA